MRKVLNRLLHSSNSINKKLDSVIGTGLLGKQLRVFVVDPVRGASSDEELFFGVSEADISLKL